MAGKFNQHQISKLLDLLDKRFNMSEIQTLCFDLGIDYQNLSGDTKIDKARELIAYCIRYDLEAKLSRKLREIRLNSDWTFLAITNSTGEQEPEYHMKELTQRTYQITNNVNEVTNCLLKFNDAVLETHKEMQRAKQQGRPDYRDHVLGLLKKLARSLKSHTNTINDINFSQQSVLSSMDSALRAFATYPYSLNSMERQRVQDFIRFLFETERTMEPQIQHVRNQIVEIENLPLGEDVGEAAIVFAREIRVFLRNWDEIVKMYQRIRHFLSSIP